MRAISLWQPWASAVAIGAKRIETRGWPTSYRGPLVIHAAKRCNKDELIEFQCFWNWCAALEPLGVVMGQKEQLWELLPFGALVAVCELVDCRPTDQMTQAELDTPRHAIKATDPWTERMMGDYSLGRFAWILSNIRRLPETIPYHGRQAFFDVADELIHDATHDFPHGTPNGTPGGAHRNALTGLQLPLLGSNQDSSDPESDVLPVTPRGSEPLIT